jgi:hypothetical protein
VFAGNMANEKRRTAQFAICAYLLSNFFVLFFFKFSIKAGKENMMDHVVREILLTT